MSEVALVVASNPDDILVPEELRKEVSGVSKEGKLPGGPHMVELGTPYYALMEAGHEVVIVSPDGGPVEPYIKDGDPDHAEYAAKLDADPVLQEKLGNTRRPETIDPKDLDGIVYIGGFGAMYGVPENVALQGLTAAIFAQEGVIGAICHGTAGLGNVRLPDGRYLLEGRDVTGLSNEEEKRGNKHKVLEKAGKRLVEDLAKDRGANYSAAPPWEAHIVIDEDARILTGQNPAAAPRFKEVLLEMLKQS